MGPIATGLGEIFHVRRRLPSRTRRSPTAVNRMTPTDLRTLQDWIIRRSCGMPGVTEINTIGGYEKEFHVTPDPHS
jgi:cobalt-zinc-cadmium resistance protein CzcA